MKNLFNIFLIMICGVVLIGCGAKALSEDYNEDELKKSSEAIIEQLRSGEYKKIVDNAGPTIKIDDSENLIKNGYESIKKTAGEFVFVSEMSFQEKNGYAVVVTIATFENRNVQFIFSFDKELKLAEIFMK